MWQSKIIISLYNITYIIFKKKIKDDSINNIFINDIFINHRLFEISDLKIICKSLVL